MQAKARHAPAALLVSSFNDHCSIGELFHLLGRVHMLDLLHQFLHGGAGPRRFTDLQASLRISPNTLADRLRALVEAGLLSRTAHRELPPRVEYEATAKAHELAPVFETLSAWCQRYAIKPLTLAPAGPDAKTPQRSAPLLALTPDPS